MKKHLSGVLVFVLIISIMLSSVASASEASTRESSFFNAYVANVVNAGNGKVTIEFGVVATHTMTQLGVYKAVVYTGSGGYVKTVYYTDPGCSGMMTKNDSVYYGNFNVQLTAGNSYYMVLTFYAKDSSGTGLMPYTTGVFTPRTIT